MGVEKFIIGCCGFFLLNFLRKGVDVFLHTDLEIFDAGENCTLVGPGHGSMVKFQPTYFIKGEKFR